MTFKEILRWPENKRTGRIPWFVTIRRLVFYPTLILALWVAVFSILCAYGYDEARRWWINAS